MLQNITGDQLWAGLQPRPWKEDLEMTEIVDGDLKGITGFFRHNDNNWRYIDLAAHIADQTGRKDVTIACFGGSVGAEAYSIAHHIVTEGLDDRIRVITSDKSARFNHIAKAAIYPQIMQDAVGPKTRARLFEQQGNGYARISERFRRVVHVAKPQTLENSNLRADIIVVSNVLGYLPETKQRPLIQKLASQANFALAVMSGHLHLLADDMASAGLAHYGTRASIERRQVMHAWQVGISAIGCKL